MARVSCSVVRHEHLRRQHRLADTEGPLYETTAMLTACGACSDLAMPKFAWDKPMLSDGAQVSFTCSEIEKSVSVSSNPYQVQRLLTPWPAFDQVACRESALLSHARVLHRQPLYNFCHSSILDWHARQRVNVQCGLLDIKAHNNRQQQGFVRPSLCDKPSSIHLACIACAGMCRLACAVRGHRVG